MGNGDKRTKRAKEKQDQGDRRCWRGKERSEGATNIPRKPESVTNAVRGFTQEEESAR